ncbi:hypothetical protein L6452_42346 [Arctium lappa]|uniref:Uncharacterized protein n=1 Tax=Arctium lappa TaxID=4217 RepID=A0ACB8XHZ7_ARCLA|nr:hypothetical protein L6452_42346 [Arctium lappa]
MADYGQKCAAEFDYMLSKCKSKGDADGGLPIFLSIESDNGIKILANAAGLRSLRATETPSFEALRSFVEPAAIKISSSSSINMLVHLISKWRKVHLPKLPLFLTVLILW